MKTLATLEPLTTKLLEIQRINSASSVLSWDQETYMPAGGGAARAEQIAVLQGLAHQKLVSPEIEQLLSQWVDPAMGQAAEQPGDLWDEPSRSLLREVWRDFSRAKKLPSDFVMTLSRECSLAQQVWAEAKSTVGRTRFRLHNCWAVAIPESKRRGARRHGEFTLLWKRAAEATRR